MVLEHFAFFYHTYALTRAHREGTLAWIRQSSESKASLIAAGGFSSVFSEAFQLGLMKVPYMLSRVEHPRRIPSGIGFFLRTRGWIPGAPRDSWQFSSKQTREVQNLWADPGTTWESSRAALDISRVPVKPWCYAG